MTNAAKSGNAGYEDSADLKITKTRVAQEVEPVIIDDELNPIITPIKTYEFFLANNAMEAFIVYTHLIYTARRQATNQVWANLKYIQAGTGLGRQKVEHAKAWLHEKGLIEYVQEKKNGKIVKGSKTYIRVKGCSQKLHDEKHHEVDNTATPISAAPENRSTEKQHTKCFNKKENALNKKEEEEAAPADVSQDYKDLEAFREIDLLFADSPPDIHKADNDVKTGFLKRYGANPDEALTTYRNWLADKIHKYPGKFPNHRWFLEVPFSKKPLPKIQVELSICPICGKKTAYAVMQSQGCPECGWTIGTVESSYGYEYCQKMYELKCNNPEEYKRQMDAAATGLFNKPWENQEAAV